MKLCWIRNGWSRMALGGYASGSLAGVITRGFHGYLVAALPTPLGRMMMLNDLIEKVEMPGGLSVQLSGEERVNAPLKTQGAEYLEEFCLEDGMPVWIFDLANCAGKTSDHGAPPEHRTCELPAEKWRGLTLLCGRPLILGHTRPL